MGRDGTTWPPPSDPAEDADATGQVKAISNTMDAMEEEALKALDRTQQAYKELTASIKIRNDAGPNFGRRRITPQDGRMVRILVVDDLPEIHYIFERALRQYNAIVEGALDATMATVASRRSRYDLLIVDVDLGPRSAIGPAFIETVRNFKDGATASDVPIVLISGILRNGELKAVAEECGASAWMSKPFGVEEIRELAAMWSPIKRDP